MGQGQQTSADQAGWTAAGASATPGLELIGVRKADTSRDAERMLERVLGYRVFPDSGGRMNLSLTDTGYGLLLVSQFTLAADTRKGMRAGFQTAADPAEAEKLFNSLVAAARSQHGGPVAAGQFGANMQVSLTNDGPVTFWLES